jgi:hypothetical protein
MRQAISNTEEIKSRRDKASETTCFGVLLKANLMFYSMPSNKKKKNSNKKTQGKLPPKE